VLRYKFTDVSVVLAAIIWAITLHLCNVGKLLPNDKVQKPRRKPSSYTRRRENLKSHEVNPKFNRMMFLDASDDALSAADALRSRMAV
jgi:hypothetical protein